MHRASASRLSLDFELAICQVADYAIFVTDASGRALSWNEGVEQVLGWSEITWIGQRVEVLYPQGTQQQARVELETALREGHAHGHGWLTRRDGSVFFAYGVTSALYGAGNHVGFLKVLRDETREHEQAQALADERARLSLALEAANAIAWEWDLQTNKTQHSSEHEWLFGPRAGQAEEFLDFVHPGDRELVCRARDRALRGDGLFAADFRLMPPGKAARWMSSRGRVQRAANTGERIVGISADITERREIEQALRAADRRKDDFLATLAHELRNPLAPIRTGLQIIQRARDNPETLEKALAMMERQLGFIVHLIDDLMDISRITHGKLQLRPRMLTLQSVVESAVEMARAAIEAEGHKLSVELPPKPIELEGDFTRLSQVFVNLLVNAAKYTDRGGRISVRVERGKDAVTVSVTDTGIGLSAEALDQVFEMFSQVGRPQKMPQGLGIGLALARALVEMHGGTIWAASPGPGKGSTFTVRLPLTLTLHMQAAGEDDDSPHLARGPRRRVLVVDDNADAAESLAILLRMSGHEVRTAHDGVDALEVAEGFHPDVVLLDIGMPHMDGLEAARRLRKLPWASNIVLLAMTGWGQDSDRERSRKAGIAHHLIKPVDPSALERLLAEDETPGGSVH